MKVKWDNGPALRAANDGSKDGLEKGGRIVLAMANAHVPLESGRLMSSGRVDFNGEAASVYYDTPYAKKLHEDRRLHIKNGREGQWLRKAALKSRPSLVECFKNALKVKFSSARGMR